MRKLHRSNTAKMNRNQPLFRLNVFMFIKAKKYNSKNVINRLVMLG